MARSFLDIEGWLFGKEPLMLARLCKSPWCEIGCWKGKSTVILAASGPGYAIDWFQGSEEHLPEMLVDLKAQFVENTEGLPITLLISDFRDCVDEVPDGLRFLFLDADHSYEGTREAFVLYAPKVERGGYVAIHDALTDWPGISKFYTELNRCPGWNLVEKCSSTVVFRKT